MDLIFQEDNFLIKTLSTHEEMEAALRLRHDVFREELKWVEPAQDGLDRDEYDPYAQSIGIFDDKDVLIGHVRLIIAPDPFMIEKDFARLLPEDGTFKKLDGMAESTRICVRKETRTDRHLSMTLAHLLYKAMYHWSRHNGIKQLITIVEKRYYVLLKRSGYPFVPIGDFKLMGEGVLSGIISLDWSICDQVLKQKKPAFFEWLNNLQDFDPARLLSRGLYSRR